MNEIGKLNIDNIVLNGGILGVREKANNNRHGH